VVVPMMMRVPSTALLAKKNRPKQECQRNQPYRAEDNETLTHGLPGKSVSRHTLGQEYCDCVHANESFF
jgi:hypothetical protein